MCRPRQHWGGRGEGEHTIKRLQLRAGQPWLVAENARYPPLPIGSEMGLVVWGVVTHVIHIHSLGSGQAVGFR